MKNSEKYLLLTLAMLLAIPFSVRGNTYSVKGTVTASGLPVRYASVTFLDSYNFSIQYNAVTDSTGAFSLSPITAVKQGSQPPKDFKLEQNYPNPFSSSTAISYELKNQSDVKVSIYDVLGREIRTFDAGYQAAGSHGIVWNGRNDFGKVVVPGVYFYKLQAGREAQVKKMVFGLGGSTNSVLLPGIVSSQAKMGADAIQIAPNGLLSSSETFVVEISNTDSTSPTIVTKQIVGVLIQSDTSFSFVVSIPQAIVYLDSTQQKIEGFGGANTLIFRPDMTPAEVQTAFGNGTGQIGMTIMRLSIPPDSTQFSANAASALAAQDLGAAIIATPWTPPAWMKSNNSEVGGSLLPVNYAAFAAHLKSFADTMAAHGVSLTGISVQNEPDFNASYQSCLWNGTQFMNFMRYNAPSVGVPVFMPESENFRHSLSDSTLNDSLAASHVAFIGGHLYGDVDKNGNVTSAVQYPLALQKGKELWMTEYLINSGGSSINSIDTGWTGALQTAKTINDCMDYNMSAYVWWYIVRYYGPIDDGSDGGPVGSVTHKGYVMSQFARFVRPGFYRASATSSPLSNVYVTAYKNGSKVVIVALNMGSGSATLPFALQGGTAISFTPYVTSSTKNCLVGNDISVSNGSFTATLDASSVTTFVSN
jgi:glucuronoarabinoxylan endo-1,4-beta-xylanase